MIMKERTYETLALIQRMLIPFGVLIVAVCDVCGWVESAKVTVIIEALSMFLAKFLAESSKKYFDAGTITFINALHDEAEDYNDDDN